MSEIALAAAPGRAAARSHRLLIIALVALAAVTYLVYSIYTSTQGSAVYYRQVSEVLADVPAVYGEPLRVMGNVQPGSITREGNSLSFTAVDATGEMPVTYDGIVPDIFGDDVEVVVEGTYGRDGVFQANTLLAKCPSKFEAKESELSQ